jgi:aspartyl-tRNA(Asn)/glutamyl-tRNA(Gln) amidotransferase subunit A
MKSDLPTIHKLAEQFRRGEVSPVEVTRSCLEKIERLNPGLNAFITVSAETALKEAQEAEKEIARGEWRGPLHGVPIALKDLVDTAGVRTTAASGLYKERVPTADAEIVRRLRQAGAVIIGKNNLHEFAYGGSSMVSYYGEVRNPQDQKRIAGGSSGGSAAAVAAGMVCAAIGTDTAGSIREPAALCGCVGLKPTYGRVSSRGVIALSPSLDHVGPITRNAEDAAIVLQAIAGYDAADITSVDVPIADYSSSLSESTKTMRVGIPRKFFYEDLNEEVARAVENALQVMRSVVKDVKEVTLEVPTDRALQAAESFALHAENLQKGSELYQPETLRRIRSGENVSVAEYIRGRREMKEARRNIPAVFGEVDLLVTPTTPIVPPAIEDLKKDPAALRPAELTLLRNTRPFNVWGLPAISIPCGTTKNGLPVGLQIAGPHWREELVLRLAHAFEQASAV